MPAIITKEFRLLNAKQFQEDFGESNQHYYLALGRPQAFADNQAFNDGTDTSPPTPNDDVGSEFYVYDDLLAAQKIASTDVSLVVPRRDWTTGTVYDYYRHDYGNINSAGSTISSDSGAASTTEPTGNKSNSVFSTADGYKWKYMYSLSASEQTNFLSSDFMHVSTESTDYSTTAGAIEHVKITAAGSGGTNGTYTNVAIRGDGSSGTATVVVSGNAVTSVTITAAGSGYTFASILAGDIGSVSGADIDFIISPSGGHATDVEKELGAFFVMVNQDIVQNAGSGDFTVGNDFRRIALIKNPTSSSSLATASTLDATKSITFSGTPGSFQADEKITQTTTGAVGFVVDFNSSTKVLRYIQPQFANQGVDSNSNLTAFSGTATVTGGTSGATGTPTSHDTTPELDAKTSSVTSGDILYVENRKPITRASDQTENIKLIVEF